jgi:DNA-directed RNA polymerase beta subunit
MYHDLLERYFAQHNNRQIIYHQIASFNQFMEKEVPETILRSCPIKILGSPDLTLTGTTRAAAGTAGTAIRVSIDPVEEAVLPTGPIAPPREVEVTIEFRNVNIRKPTIFENNGAVTPMYPNDARLRNITYAAPVYVDLHISTTLFDPATGEKETRTRALQRIHVGKIPVMVGSKFCMLCETPEKMPRDLVSAPRILAAISSSRVASVLLLARSGWPRIVCSCFATPRIATRRLRRSSASPSVWIMRVPPSPLP